MAAGGSTDLIDEQAWDRRAPVDRPSGDGTRSATPLTWWHTGPVRSACTIQRGRPVDQHPLVAERYAGRYAAR